MKTTRQSLEKTLFNWLPPILWAAVIFSFSSLPQISVSQFLFWDFIAKKAAHITEYAIFYILLFRATGRKYLTSYVLLALYAATDEFHQKFVPGRTPSPLDVGFDITGANIASYVIWKLTQFRQSKQKK
jgi:VanZ family protein